MGFAPADWALFVFTAALLFAAFAWRPVTQRWFEALAERKRTCAIGLFVLPIVLRLLLLPQHPVPTPDIYDEFAQLLVADTLLHGRLANPPHPLHQFFETFFVLQQPTYSAMYPLGQGMLLAFGRAISGVAWTGVLVATGGFCAGCYWMLRGWVKPVWALLGGLLTVAEFGPLCQWMNSYWGGGALAAAAGCLMFGALPRIKMYARPRDCLLLGAGFAVHMLTRQFETVFLLVAIVAYFAPRFQGVRRLVGYASIAVLPAVLVILLQNHAVTKQWFTLPEALHRAQYGIPISLTFEPLPKPSLALTPQQELDFKAESLQHGPGTETVGRFLMRMGYRIRYYRFFFLPALYVALIGFVCCLHEKRWRYVAAVLALFALGTNFFPYLLVHYMAAVAGLFVLASVVGLQRVSEFRGQIAQVLIVLALGEFGLWYGLHLFERPEFLPLLRYETWDSINHENPVKRIEVRDELADVPGKLLVFVQYSARHLYQEEWVWNEADIDNARVVFARDLGSEENKKLIEYYPKRRVLLLEPDGREAELREYGK